MTLHADHVPQLLQTFAEVEDTGAVEIELVVAEDEAYLDLAVVAVLKPGVLDLTLFGNKDTIDVGNVEVTPLEGAANVAGMACVLVDLFAFRCHAGKVNEKPIADLSAVEWDDLVTFALIGMLDVEFEVAADNMK